MPVDIGSIKRNDQIAGAAAILAFILALIPGVVSASWNDQAEEEAAGAPLPDLDSVNLWHDLGLLSALLMLVGLAALAAVILQRPEVQSLPIRWIATGVWGLTTLFALLYVFTYGGDVPSMFDDYLNVGPGIVGWLLLLACIVVTVFAALGARESGEALPGRGQSAGPAQPTPPAA